MCARVPEILKLIILDLVGVFLRDSTQELVILLSVVTVITHRREVAG